MPWRESDSGPPDPAPRVLVVEDDADLRLAVHVELRAAGLTVDAAADLAGAAAALAERTTGAGYDCVVVDRMLPDGDAAGFVHARRLAGWAAPVLFLTALGAAEDRIAGFEHGGDDYLVKPFAVAELTARVLALCRRAPHGRPSVLHHGDLEMDCARREVRRAAAAVRLSVKEFAVLEYLMTRQGEVVARGDLIEHCWDASTDPMSNVVDVVVRRLRARLGEPGLIHSVRGVGYRLQQAGPAS